MSTRLSRNLGKKSTVWAISSICTTLIALATPSSYALDADKSAFIEIQSDSAEFNESNGTAIYRGQVELSQGTLSIKSDSLTIFNGEKGVNKVMADGKPAYYQQLVEKGKPPVKAQATRIIYQPQSETITLEGQAKLEQGDSFFQGEHIDYDIKRHILNARGRTNAEGSSNKGSQGSGRVKMVIPPTRQ